MSSMASAGADPSGESIAVDEVAVPTTEPGKSATPVAGDDYPEYAVLAETEGISVDQAKDLFQSQGEVTAIIEAVLDRPEYVDFMFTEDGLTGRLVVEPDANRSNPFGDVKLPSTVEVSRASIDRPTRERMTADLRGQAEALLGAEFVGVIYNAFDNHFIVHAGGGAAGIAAAEEALAATVALERGSAGATVTVREAEQTRDVRGGQTATRSGAACTTGFGINDNGFSGYLTAGHCGDGTWTINGNTSTATNGIVVNGYDDRMSIRAAGHSWLVRISPTAEVDMSSSAGHVFLGTRYCHFGQNSDVLRCGTIAEVNFPHNTSLGNRWTSRTPADCFPGDSGGPVWLPSSPERRPVGLQSGQVTATADCLYVALDDQLDGTGWTLL